MQQSRLPAGRQNSSYCDEDIEDSIEVQKRGDFLRSLAYFCTNMAAEWGIKWECKKYKAGKIKKNVKGKREQR